MLSFNWTVLLGLYAGILGIILTAFFPCDVGCEANPTTFWGKGHGVLVAISALLVFTGMVALTWRMHVCRTRIQDKHHNNETG